MSAYIWLIMTRRVLGQSALRQAEKYAYMCVSPLIRMSLSDTASMATKPQLYMFTTYHRIDLAEALTTNKHLEVLNISCNPLCDDGIQHLAQALQVNHHMKKLVVDNCGVTDIGLECLVKLIQDNNVLNTLSVRSKALFLSEIDILPFLVECFQN